MNPLQKSHSIKHLLVCTVLALLLQGAVPAALYRGPFEDNGAGPGVIPDNSPIGLADAQTLTGLAPSMLDAVLTVQLSGSYIDDLRGYIRLGNAGSSPIVSLDAYLAQGNASFAVPLSSFAGMNPNTTWTLYFADTSPGGQNTLNGWSLDVSTVPEPANAALAVFGLLLASAGVSSWWRKQRRWARTRHRTCRGRFIRWRGNYGRRWFHPYRGVPVPGHSNLRMSSGLDKAEALSVR